MARVAWARITGDVGTALLSRSERERATSFRSASRARQFVAGRALLRQLLARAAPEAAALEIGADARGRPVLPGERPAISVSHTEGWVAVAVGGRAVGVDIEGPRPVRRAHELACRFYHPSERTDFEALSQGEVEARFLDRWVLKEALAKATGEGLGAVIGRMPISARAPWTARGRTPGGADGSDFGLSLVRLPDGARLGLATSRDDPGCQVTEAALPAVGCGLGGDDPRGAGGR